MGQGQYTQADVASAPQTGQYSAADIAPTPKGFSQSFVDQVGDIVKGQVTSWLHGGGSVSSGGGDPRQTLNETFNPFHPLESAGYLVPQPIKDVVQKLREGNYAGAAGQGAALATQVRPVSGESALEASAPVIRGAAKTTNAILHNAPDVIPSSLVPPLVKKLATQVTVPGENYGLVEPPAYDAARVQARSDATKARQQSAFDLSQIPEQAAAPAQAVTPAPADRQAYLDQIAAKRQAMGLTKPEPAPEAAAAPSVPTEDEVAKGIGYSGGAKQAQQRLGPQAWQQTYQKIIQPPATVEDVIDKAVPPDANKGLNMQTKAKVDFYVQKGNVDAAKEAIQSAATQAKPSINRFADAQDDAAIQQQMRQNLQQQYATGRLVEGREQAAGMSADRTKLAGIPKQGEQFATRLSRYPAPEADLETNKMLGYDQHATPQPVATPTARPNEQPWGGLSDDGLTAILQKSVELAKKSKRVQTK